MDPGSLSNWVQTGVTLAGILVAVVASHQRIIAGMQRLDERMREHSTVVSSRLEHVEHELDQHGRQLHEHALVLARLEQALGSSTIPFPVIVEKLHGLEDEIRELRKWRHEMANQMQKLALEQQSVNQKSEAAGASMRGGRRASVSVTG